MKEVRVAPKTRELAFMGVLAGLYVVTTIVLAPLSFGPLQFRLADMLQPFVLKGKKYIYAIALGTFLANMNSPFGIIDWGMMPIVSIIAGYVAYYIAKASKFSKFSQYMSMLTFAMIIALGVSVVLNVSVGLPYLVGFTEVFITVGAVNMVGVVLVNKIVKALASHNLFV